MIFNKRLKFLLGLLMLFLWNSCETGSIVDPIVKPDPPIYRIPVVVHIIHFGEPVGQGYNLSTEQIESQLRVINEDFRRKQGTRGFNNHPDGGDARIEFELARFAPDGTGTNGVVRVNSAAIDNPSSSYSTFDYYAYYSYWDPDKYLNIWTMPLPESMVNVFLGKSTGPESDLPGTELLLRGEPYQAEGILINSAHFGESGIDSDYNLGRTLTHEIGHYLGLLHPWGDGDCSSNDYCDDTPPVDKPFSGPVACDGQPVMTANFMNYAPDASLNIFTNEQIARMHYILENSPRRQTLTSSSGLIRREG